MPILDGTAAALIILGARIRQQRNAAGLSQSVLADKIGCTRSSVANIEAGRQDTTVTRLTAIADALHVAPGDLLPGGNGEALRSVAALTAENWRLRQVLVSAKATLDGINLDTSPEVRESLANLAAKTRGERA